VVSEDRTSPAFIIPPSLCDAQGYSSKSMALCWLVEAPRLADSCVTIAHCKLGAKSHFS
jgi:hypothetical protein